MILGIIIGILIWQTIIFLVAVISKENEDLIFFIGLGIWFLICQTIKFLLKFILTKYHNKFSVVVNVYKGDEYFMGNHRISKKLLSKFKTYQNDGYWLKVRNDENVGRVYRWTPLNKVHNGFFTWNWVVENCGIKK